MKAELAIQKLIVKRLKIALAESCTGGLLAGALTSISGSSQCFELGIVTYSNQAKHEMLGVPKVILEKYGAVSYQTAYWMAKGVREIAKANLGLSITGIAGPLGGDEIKPVGLVYMALVQEEFSISHKYLFKGDREEVRNLAVEKGIDLILQYGV